MTKDNIIRHYYVEPNSGRDKKNTGYYIELFTARDNSPIKAAKNKWGMITTAKAYSKARLSKGNYYFRKHHY